MVPVTSSCQLSVAVDAQSTDLCRAGATSRYGERCAQLPWCAHPSSDVWRPLAQPLSTISTHTPWWRRPLVALLLLLLRFVLLFSLLLPV